MSQFHPLQNLRGDTIFPNYCKVKHNTNVNENKNEDKKSSETKQTSSIEDVIYPMYIPANTYLSNKEKVSKDDGERLILTFDGDNPFMLIEETVTYEKEHLIVPTYGELEVMASTVAIVNDNSVNWIDNNIEYYVVSDKLSKSELLDIARSISVLPVSKQKYLLFSFYKKIAFIANICAKMC